jgi:site-specific DNA-cytosine methylase
MAAQELGVAVVGGSEVDPKLATAFTKCTGAKSYPGLEELIEGGKRGMYPELHGLDIVSSGVPCPYRSNAGSLTGRKGKEKRKAGSERHLFTIQVEFFALFRPRAAMIEQPPPSAPHLAEYMKVIEGMQRCGYHCQHRVLNCAEHSDQTSRCRWFMIGLRHNGAIEWPLPLTEFEGLKSVLDDPKTVCLARIVPATERFVPRKSRSQPDAMTANKLGSYRVHGITDDRSVRVYDPAYPLPSATSTKSVPLGSPGGLVRTWVGDYQVSAFEVARAHGFTKEALAQVQRLTATDEQWKWVANSTPRRTVQVLLSAILVALQSPRQLSVRNAGPITSQSDVAQCAASKAANSGLPTKAATAPELVLAVQRLVDAMPTKDELAALQAADPETKVLLEWIRRSRAKKEVPDLPSKWRKEAKYLHLLDGVLFFRPVFDPHDELVDVPVLPSGLRDGALMAMHPASKALFALARKRYYWPSMSADCTRIVHGCGHTATAPRPHNGWVWA